MKIIYLYLTVLLTLISCCKQTITIKKDLSGTYAISVQANDDAVNLFNSSRGTNSSLDKNIFFLLSKEQIENIVESEKSLKLKDLSIAEGKRTTQYDITMSFKAIEKLPDIFLKKYIATQIYNTKGTVFIKTTLNPSFLGENGTIHKIYNDLDQNTKSIVDVYSDMITISLVYNCPSEILKTQSNKKGILDQSNKSVEFTYSLKEILQNKTDTEILISFKK